MSVPVPVALGHCIRRPRLGYVHYIVKLDGQQKNQRIQIYLVCESDGSEFVPRLSGQTRPVAHYQN